MSRKPKDKIAEIQLDRKGAVQRARRLAGFLENNRGRQINSDDILNYLTGSVDDPAKLIVIR